MKLYLVVPCYNEEEVLMETATCLAKKFDELIKNNTIDLQSRIVFVDDGSKDNTWNIIESLTQNNQIFGGIKLSRNSGHQNALLAGLMTVKKEADISISMDADLQDDISAIDRFIEEYEKGNDIVYGVRSSRKKDTFFKKHTALIFYKLMHNIGVNIVYNHADYRLMSKRALYELEQFKEVNLFLRGIIPLIGFKTSIVKYERHERFAGESKYPFKKMLVFAFDGVTSFSIKPIRLVLSIGILFMILSVGVLIYATIGKLLGINITGWTFLVSSIWLLSGVQMLSLGIIGEYIGKIYNEVKARPRFIVDKFIIKK